MSFVAKFKNNEVKIIKEDTHLARNKEYIKNAIDRIHSDNAKFYSQEEIEAIIETTLSKYENNL